MKKAFTLIELLISIAIFSIMIYALSEMIKNLNITKDILQNKIKNELNEQKILKVLYYDILNAVSLNIEKSPNPDFIR